jgi:glycosidase
VTILPTADVEKMLRSPYADKDARTSAEWVHDAVIYEVYLRSFSQAGTFKGLEDRLPELKALGVTVVWLMPIHPVGELNRKGTLGSPYSISDYYAINPEFGTLDDFRSLVAATHRQGMKIIVDLVANHTSWDSKLLFEHPEFFTKNEEGAIVAPNADWTDVADLNYDSHELRKYMIRMMRYWVEDVGIDGYRCDVAELVPTDFWETARGELDKIKPVMMLAEGTLPEHHVKAFDLTYAWNTYDVLSHIIDGETHADVFDGLLQSEANQYPRSALRLRFNTNHDKNAWDAPAVEKFTPAGAKATAVLAFTLPGVPLIYNGEEVGNPKRLSLFEKVDIDWSTGEEFRTLYTALTEMRSAHPALRRGSYIPLENTGGSKILTFARQSGNDAVLVAVNFSREQRSASVELTSELGNAWRLVNGAARFLQEGKTLSFDLPAFGHLILARKN